MRATQIAFGFILLSVSPSVGQPASMDLARRYVAANGGMTVIIMAPHIGILNSERCKQNITCRATNTGRMKAVLKAVEQDRPAVTEADEDLAHVVSQTLDTRELESYLAFWESPDGQSIQRKRAIQGIAFYEQERVPAGLTKAQQDALSAYLHTPAAAAVTAKEKRLLEHTIPIDIKLQMLIARDGSAIYCQKTGYCTPWMHETK